MSETSKRQEIVPAKPETTSEERTWAALAHISAIITLLLGVPTGGLGGLLLVFVPFGIYLAYKDKSRYVAEQAAQAFALQIVATVGFLITILVGVIAMVLVWVITGILCVVVIGVILIPVALLLTFVIILIWLALPLVVGAFSIIATVETGNGKDYVYPYLGERVLEWLAEHEANSTPAV
ncbi:MAG: DUF4870 domain-containing protein [Anaerolineae bacterium]|nr:DUF4870 domain-containing protein [Anaerolineae bacterium]